MHYFRDLATSPVSPVLVRRLFLKAKYNFTFYKKQIINRSARVIFSLARLVMLYYNTVNRKAVSRTGRLSSAHAFYFNAHKVFCCGKFRILVKFLSLVMIEKPFE